MLKPTGETTGRTSTWDMRSGVNKLCKVVGRDSDDIRRRSRCCVCFRKPNRHGRGRTGRTEPLQKVNFSRRRVPRSLYSEEIALRANKRGNGMLEK